MSTTSTNFSFVVATTADTVSVVDHIANNWSSVDSILSVAHTGTGQLKAGLPLTTPTLTGATLVGTMTGGTIVATTGTFQTVTATGGALTVNSFTIGTSPYPATASAAGTVLTVSGTAAKWAAAAVSGADTNMSNLGTPAINTSLGNFTASTVTVAEIIATSGTLTGIAAVTGVGATFQTVTATGGLLTGLSTCSGTHIMGDTATFATITATGGILTAVTGSFASLQVGTYSYPATAGATGEVLTVTTGNAVWIAPASATATVGDYLAGWASGDADTEVTDTGETTYTRLSTKEIMVTRAGTYRVKFDMKMTGGGTSYCKIYKNAGAVGTEQNDSGGTYATKSEDLALAAGDKLTLYWKNSVGGAYGVAVENFRLYGALPSANHIVVSDT